MEEEDIIPVDPIAADAAVVVSETDAAAHSHSSGDEDEGWLARRYQRRRVGPAGDVSSAINEASYDNQGDSDGDDDGDMSAPAGPGDMYCKNQDDEDEAWVYKHMRSGREEACHVMRGGQHEGDATNKEETKASHENNGLDEQIGEEDKEGKSLDDEKPTSQNPQLEKALLLKPRNSDAVLSCPRCFNIVCMDCQQHERYANQYRAMFVMNIGVDWNKKMVYDDAIGGLKMDSNAGILAANDHNEDNTHMELDDAAVPDRVPHDGIGEEKREPYYSVHCSYCKWEIAALDMDDEIYYFYGCIASS